MPLVPLGGIPASSCGFWSLIVISSLLMSKRRYENKGFQLPFASWLLTPTPYQLELHLVTWTLDTTPDLSPFRECMTDVVDIPEVTLDSRLEDLLYTHPFGIRGVLKGLRIYIALDYVWTEIGVTE